MNIGEVIKTYRKQKNLTQEQMATYLGVTPSAVNKWENGASNPDIALLAPIARLLGISTDTLLSYKKELSKEEMEEIIQTIIKRIQTEPYDKVFEDCKTYINQYPSNDALIYNITSILDSYRIILQIEQPERYDNEIKDLFSRLLQSDDIEIKQCSAEALFYFFIQKEKFHEAKSYIEYIPKQRHDRRRLEALLSEKQGKIDTCYQMYEQMLLTGYNEISWALNGIYNLFMKENNITKAEQMVEKQERLANVMELGKYMEVSLGLDLAIYKKDKEKALEILETMVEQLDSLENFKKSKLYTHIDFSSSSGENIAFLLKKGFEDDEAIDFLKEDIRYKKLMEKLKEI